MTIIKTEITNETSIDSCNQEISNSIPVSDSGEYIITYNYNNDNNNTKTIVRIEKGKSLNLLSLSNSINTGYIFNGWFSTKFGGVKVGDGGTSITPQYDMTLFAHWVPSPDYKRVNIQYHVNGGSLASTHGAAFGINGSLITLNGSSTIQSIVHGQSLSSSGLLNYYNPDYLNIVRNCYYIVSGSEWCLTQDGKNCYDQSKVYPSSDFCEDVTKDCTITLYANWAPKTFTIALNGQGATTKGTEKIYLVYNYRWFLDAKKTKWMQTSNNPIVIPKRTGYTFGGYFTKTNGSGTQIITNKGYIISKKITKFTANGSLYAIWIAVPPTITFSPNGGTNNNGTDFSSGGTVTVTCNSPTGISR